MKPKILIFIDWYLPAYKAGGPVKSVANIVNILKDNFDFDIVTSDRDFGDAKPYENIILDKWNDLGSGTRVIYLSREGIKKKIWQIVVEGLYDRVYLNSLYSINFSFFPLLISKWKSKRVILAPRGMLGEGALSLKKYKKYFFISLYKFLLLDNFVTWQATSTQEVFEIKRIFTEARIVMVPNISFGKTLSSKKVKKGFGILRLCFISRISKKKNLLFGLQIIEKLSSKLNSGDQIFLDIFGPQEDREYWKDCEILINKLNSENVVIRYQQSLHPDEISDVLSEYHFLFLPTKNENYGHIIVEAFQSGTPVLISDQTPWRNLEAMNIGFDFDLNNPDEVVRIIENCLRMNSTEYEKMLASVQDFVKDKLNPEATILHTNNLFS